MKKILSSDESLKAELFQTFLEDNGIPVLVIDKTDSVYLIIGGHQELYVRAEDFDRAYALLQEFKQNNQS